MWKVLVQFWTHGGKEIALAAAGAIPGTVLGWFLNELSQQRREAAADLITPRDDGSLLVDGRALKRTGEKGVYQIPCYGLLELSAEDEAAHGKHLKQLLLICKESTGGGGKEPTFSIFRTTPR